MKRILLAVIVLLLMAAVGCCQESKQSLQLTVKSNKQAYFIDEKITLVLTVKNLSSQGIPLFDGDHLRTVVILDGKEYKNIGVMAWGGPDAILPKGEMNIAMELLAYGITGDILTVGKHNLAVKLNGAFSDAITIEVIGKETS